MSKVILIKGSGFGKSCIGNLLAEKYQREDTPFQRLIIGSRINKKQLKAIETFAGYSIIETNTSELNITPWQTIEISGGR